MRSLLRCAKQNLLTPIPRLYSTLKFPGQCAPWGKPLIAADHFETHLEVTAERRLLRRLEAGCAAPIGAYATVKDGDLVLTAVVASPDGTESLRHTSATGELDVPGAERLGIRVAEDLLQMGAAALAGLEVK